MSNSISLIPSGAFSTLILRQLSRSSCDGKSNNKALCVLLNLPSSLNVISYTAPLKKISFFGSLNFCSNCADIDDGAGVQS